MTKDIELELSAHNLDCTIDALKAEFSEIIDEDDVERLIELSMKLGELYAKRDFNKKLEGCVVVPESEHNEMAQYKDLYKRAIVNAKKRKNQINWAHVAGLGVGSGRAVELCKELGIDPHETDMKAMLEAARGGK